MTLYTSVIDFSDVDFSHAELFASVVGSIKRSVPESAEFDFDLTEGRTITLTFHTTSQRTAVLSLCRAYFEALKIRLHWLLSVRQSWRLYTRGCKTTNTTGETPVGPLGATSVRYRLSMRMDVQATGGTGLPNRRNLSTRSHGGQG
jgi:hypothetical protein